VYRLSVPIRVSDARFITKIIGGFAVATANEI